MDSLKRNVKAIQAVKTIMAEGRRPTAEEQQAIAGYTGMGRHPSLFAYYRPKKEYEKARDLLDPDRGGILTQDEWESLRKSTENAHFTSGEVVQEMWRAVERLGMTKPGKVMEPAVGVGNFLGLIPESLRSSAITAVELESLTGNMAKALYPDANVQINGYENVAVPEDWFDLNISNVPFNEAMRIGTDPKYRKINPTLHDYFYLKMLDSTRPGGLVVAITSAGTMDKANDSVRRMIARKADLVGAIRLPGVAFKDAAGTMVVTDILFLRKRKKGERRKGPAWMDTKEVKVWGKDPVRVNEYFADNPGQVVGKIDRSGKMRHGDEKGVTAPPNWLSVLHDTVDKLPQNVFNPDDGLAAVKGPESPTETIEGVEGVKEGGFAVKDGKVWLREKNKLVEKKMSAKKVALVKALVKLRDTLGAVFDAELAGATGTSQREQLNKVYDRFVKKHGEIRKSRDVRLVFRDDPDYPRLLALETKKGAKADIFTKAVVRHIPPVDSAETVEDAIGVVLNERGHMDIDRMAALTGRQANEVAGELAEKGLAFLDPNGTWEVKDLYLSGNVKKKLAQAHAAVEQGDARFERNVAALQEVIPPDKPHTEIEVSMGAPWVTPEDYRRFVADSLQSDMTAAPDMVLNPVTAQWHVAAEKQWDYIYEGPTSAQFRTDRVGFMRVLDAAMNQKQVVVRDTVADNRTVVNMEATEAANAAVANMRREFDNWIWRDGDRATRLHRAYNDTYNTNVPVSDDGSHLTMPGMTPEFDLHPHNKNGVWRVIRRGRGMFAHEVGTGKTYIMAGGAMELRRLGLARKPAFAVPKRLIEQTAAEARKLYPAAKILSVGKKFDAKRRKQTIAQIATGDWDIVIMTHDNLKQLPMKPQVIQNFIREQTAELDAVIAQAKADNKNDRIVKQLEKQKDRIVSRWNNVIASSNKDDAVFFEETGIDALFLDEAHKVKNLPIHTNQMGVKGMNNSPSLLSQNVQMIGNYLYGINGGRGLVLLTGTPIDNQITEVYAWQKYLQPDDLEARDIYAFDSWHPVFGIMSERLEFKHDTTIDTVRSFSKFRNMKQLRNMMDEDMSVVFADDVTKVKRPERQDREVAVPETPLHEKYRKFVVYRSVLSRGRRPEPGTDMALLINLDAAGAAIDMRMVLREAPDEEGSKLNRLVQNVLKVHNDNPGKTQFVFSNIGVGHTEWKFSVYDEVIRKLVDGGIPRGKIIDGRTFLGDSTAAEQARGEAMDRLNSGDASVAIGSTDSLGTGFNGQRRAIAAHHLDVPYTPGQITQRNGRVWRQGNEAYDEKKPITVYNYVTENSQDAFRWGLIARKSGFINDFLRNELAADEMEDFDANLLTPDQMMAIASGNPRMVELMELKSDQQTLSAARDFHRQKIINANASRLRFEHQKAELEQRVKALTDYRNRASSALEGSLTVQVEGENEVLEKARDAGAALAQAREDLAGEDLFDYKKVATAGDGAFEIIAYGRRSGKWRSSQVEEGKLFVRDARSGISEDFTAMPANAAEPQSVIASLRAAIKRSWDSSYEETKLAEVNRALKGTVEDVAFDREREYQQNQQKIDRMERELKGEKKPSSVADLKLTEEEDRTYGEWLRERVSRLRYNREKAKEQAAEKEAAAVAKNVALADPNAYYVRFEDGFKKVKGKPVTIKGFEELDLFVHRSASDNKVWNVSDGASGLSVSVGNKTQKAAIAAATETLNKYGLEKSSEVFAEGLEETGGTPRYKALQAAEEDPVGDARDPEDEPEVVAATPTGQPRTDVLAAPQNPLTNNYQPREMPTRPDRPSGFEGQISAPKVIEAIADAVSAFGLDVPLRVGRIPPQLRAAGIYKQRVNVARIRVANSIEKATHEFAHAISVAVWGKLDPKRPGWPGRKEFSKLARAELVALGHGLYSDSPTGGFMSEGFAEFIRLWVTDPKSAKKFAPNFLKEFEANVLDKRPGAREAMLRARSAAETWSQQGAKARVGETIAKRGERDRAVEKARTQLGKAFSIATHIESLHPMETFVKSIEAASGRPIHRAHHPVRTAEALRTTQHARAKQMVESAMIDLAGNKVGRPLGDIRKMIRPAEREDFTLFLFAQRAIASWAPTKKWPKGRNPGISLEDAKAVRDEVLSDTDRAKRFNLAAELVYEWNEGVLNYAAQASPAFREIVRRMRAHPDEGGDPGFYIPLQREFTEIERRLAKMGGAGGRIGRDSISQLRKGSGRRVLEPFTVMISNATKIVAAAHNRRVLDQIIRLGSLPDAGKWIEEVPVDRVPGATAQLTEVIRQVRKEIEAKGGTVTIEGPEGESLDLAGESMTFFTQSRSPTGADPIIAYWDGKKVKWYWVDPDLYNTLASMDVYRLPEIAGIPVLDWMMGKPTRVFRAGTTGLRASFGLIWNMLRDPQTLYINTQTNTNAFKLFGTWVHAMGAVAKYRVTGKTNNPYLEAMLNVGVEMAQPLGQDIPHTRRAAHRLFEGRFKRTIDVRNWLDVYREFIQFPELAPRLAEFTLLAKKIGWEPGTEMNMDQSLFLLTAAKQVTTDFTASGDFSRIMNQIAPFYNAAIQGPRANLRAAKRNPTKVAFRGLQLAAMTLALWWMYKDEEWWVEMPWREKWLHWHFPVKIGGEEVMFRIPRAFEVGLVFSALPEMFADAAYHQDPKGMTEYMKVFFSVAVPDPKPVVLNEALEQFANRDFFWNRPIVPRSEKDRVPLEEQYNEWTSRASIAVGRIFNISPRRVDHAMSGLFGPVGRDIVETLGLGPSATVDTKREKEPADIPIVGRLFQRGGHLGYRPRSIDELYRKVEPYVHRQNSIYQDETPRQRQERLMLQDAIRAVSALGYIRSQIGSKEKRRQLLQEALKISQAAIDAAEKGNISARPVFKALAKEKKTLKDLLKERQKQRMREAAGVR